MDIKFFLRRLRIPRKIFYHFKFLEQKRTINKSIWIKQNKIFASYKNKFKGKRCFIIGNGPSLNVNDLDKLKNEYTFASNRVFTLYDRTEWRPTFYAAQDESVLKSIKNSLAFCANGSELCFISMTMYDECKDCVKEFSNIMWMPLKYVPPYKNSYRFSPDASKEVIEGLTITYSCMQLAFYMGFSEIYLIGVDHNYGFTVDDDGKVISEDSTIKEYFNEANSTVIVDRNLPKIVEMARAYRSAERFSRENEFRIFNSTRGGKLDIYERKNIDDVI